MTPMIGHEGPLAIAKSTPDLFSLRDQDGALVVRLTKGEQPMFGEKYDAWTAWQVFRDGLGRMFV